MLCGEAGEVRTRVINHGVRGLQRSCNSARRGDTAAARAFLVLWHVLLRDGGGDGSGESEEGVHVYTGGVE